MDQQTKDNPNNEQGNTGTPSNENQGSDTAISSDENDKGSEHEGNELLWCSWCYQQGTQELLQHNWIKRNVYKCSSCLHLTLHCRFCKIGMSRKFPTYDDKLCAVCDHTISKWGDKPKKANIHKYCSWCFENAEHILFQKNYIKRSVYQCQACGRRTLPCRKCSEAFVRGSETYDDELCLKCDKTIADWSKVEENQKKISMAGWCSWCFEKTNHKLESKNIVRRSIYTCEECSMRTLTCVTCSEGMTRGGLAWDDSICANCSWETGKGWDALKSRKDAILNEMRDKDRVISELSRQSAYRDLAAKTGMIRPFLFLVAMPPVFRNQVAGALGWTLFTQKYFGDPHQEAWHIINDNRVGMQARCNYSYEKLNPLTKNCNWYNVLVRVGKVGLHKDMHRDVPWKTTQDLSTVSSDPFYPELEEEWLVELCHMMMAHMTPQQKQQLEDDMEAAESKKVMQLFMTKAGLTRQDALKYAYNVTSKVMASSASVARVVSAFTNVFINGIQSSVGIVGAQIGVSIGLAGTPLFVLGLVGLAKEGFLLMFGSSEGRLFVPLVLILNQRILLAAEDIRIEDYY